MRGKCAQLGFPNVKADTKVAMLSGGEKARLLMGLCSFNGPHLLIMDEPTNHLDIDSRAALIEAINDYKGAVILVSPRSLPARCLRRSPLAGRRRRREAVRRRHGRLQGAGARHGEAEGEDREKAAAEKPPKPSPEPAGQEAPRRARREDGQVPGSRSAASTRRWPTATPSSRSRRKAAQLAKQRNELAKALSLAEEDWLMLSAEQDAAQ